MATTTNDTVAQLAEICNNLICFASIRDSMTEMYPIDNQGLSITIIILSIYNR